MIKSLNDFILLVLIFIWACNVEKKKSGSLENSAIMEASGLAASIKNPGCFWTHNDSRDKARIFLIDSLGRGNAELRFENLKNRDWEDIAVGPGPDDSLSYIYLGEIGDNNSRYKYKNIYRLVEPVISLDTVLYISQVDVITFQFADGNRDAETLMVDPLTKDLYIVSKREHNVHVYGATFPQSLDDTLTLENELTLPLTQITGGDISRDGLHILLKNYDSVFYWDRNKNEKVRDAFTRKLKTLNYAKEPQGEAIAWSIDGHSYFTLSEALAGIRPRLHQYIFKQ